MIKLSTISRQTFKDLSPRRRLAVIAAAVVVLLLGSLGVYAAVTAPPTGTIRVLVYDSSDYDAGRSRFAQLLPGVTVHIRANSGPDRCSSTSVVSDASGVALFAGCGLSHGSRGTEKYIVSYAAKTGYIESAHNPVKVGSGRFVVKAGRTTTVREHLDKVQARASGASTVTAIPSTHAMETVLQDDARLISAPNVGTLQQTYQGMVGAGVTMVRLTAQWDQLSPNRPTTIGDTDDPAYNWSTLDRAVYYAQQAGLGVMIEIGFRMPNWESGVSDPMAVPAKAPNPDDYASFALAVASRYGGTHAASAGAQTPAGATLPAVATYTIFNEPNLKIDIPNQAVDGSGNIPAAAVYRDMVNKSYINIHNVLGFLSANGQPVRVLAGNVSSTGTDLGATGGSRPLQFMLQAACADYDPNNVSATVSGNFHAWTGCTPGTQLLSDGWAHHPYSRMLPPDLASDSGNKGNLTMGDIGVLGSALQVLQRANRMHTRSTYGPQPSDIWLTEGGYETKDSSGRGGYITEGQAPAYMALTDYLAWLVPSVKSVPQFELADINDASPCYNSGSTGNWRTGLLHDNLSPKDGGAVLTGFQMSILPVRQPNGNLVVWGHARVARSTQVTITSSNGGSWNAQTDAQGYFSLLFNAPSSKDMTAIYRVSGAGVTSPGQPVTQYTHSVPTNSYSISYSTSASPYPPGYYSASRGYCKGTDVNAPNL